MSQNMRNKFLLHFISLIFCFALFTFRCKNILKKMPSVESKLFTVGQFISRQFFLCKDVQFKKIFIFFTHN